MQPTVFDFWHGMDVLLMTAPTPAAGANAQIIVQGWRWWILASATFNLVVPAAQPVAQGLVSVNTKGITVFTAAQSSSVGPAAAMSLSFGLMGSGVVAPVLVDTGALPWVPIIGDGSVILGAGSTGVLWTVNSCACCLVGLRSRSAKEA
jgi:hypothetical protein